MSAELTKTVKIFHDLKAALEDMPKPTASEILRDVDQAELEQDMRKVEDTYVSSSVLSDLRFSFSTNHTYADTILSLFQTQRYFVLRCTSAGRFL